MEISDFFFPSCFGACCSEFADIFDLEHFKKVLENDVRIVSSLPSTHVMTRPVEEKRTPLHATPEWIRSRYHRRVRKTTNVCALVHSFWNLFGWTLFKNSWSM